MKSVELKLNEALAALDKAGKREKFDEQLKPIKEKAEGAPVPIEVQLTLAETTLRESHIVRKHNGATETFVEGNPFNEYRGSSFSEGYVQETTNTKITEGDKAILESLESLGEITSEQKRVALGLPPAEYATLNESQKREFDFARSIGINEVDALRLTKITAIGRNR